MRAVEQAAHGVGGAVILEGEAGIGKSVLLRELADDVRSLGSVLFARADPIEGGLPYAAFANALASAPARAGEEVASLRTELAEALELGSATTVANVHAAAVRYLAVLRTYDPVFLVMDDPGVADADTVALISLLLRRPARFPLVLVATVRTPEGEPHPAFVALLDRLRRDELLTVVRLAPLSSGELRPLVETLLGCVPDESLIEELGAQTQGNPLFAREAVLGWDESGLLEKADGRCRLRGGSRRLPSDRRGALVRRVLRVGDDVRAVAQVTALLGTARLDRLDLVADLAGLYRADASRAFDTLVARGVLVPLDDEAFGFSHQLLREALYHGIPPARRWEWHLAVADWLAARPRSAAVVLELAVHKAETAVYGDRGAALALVAAGDLLSGAAPRSSIPRYERALSIMAEDEPDRASVSSRLARAQFLAGRPAEASATGLEALRVLAPGAERARTVGLVAEALNAVGAASEAVALLEETGVDAGDLRLGALRAHLLVYLGRVDDAVTITKAIEERLATAEPPPADRIATLVHVAHVHSLLHRHRSVEPVVAQLIEVAAAAPLPSQLTAYANVAYLAAERGDEARVADFLNRTEALMSASGWTLFRAEAALARMLHGYVKGDWDGALATVDHIADELEDSQSYTHLALLGAFKADILAKRGQWAHARRVLGEHAPSPAVDVFRAWAAGGVDLLTGDLDSARSVIEAALPQAAFAKGRCLLATRLAEVELAAGRPDRSAALVAEFACHDPEAADNHERVTARAVYGTATGDADVLADALGAARALGDVFVEATVHFALAELDVDSEANFAEAYRRFRQLDADPWRHRVVRELRRRGMKVPRYRRPRSDVLTDVELQIARLVQQGSRNREIAAVLSMSKKTVEANLTRIYVKVGVTSRLGLVHWLETASPL